MIPTKEEKAKFAYQPSKGQELIADPNTHRELRFCADSTQTVGPGPRPLPPAIVYCGYHSLTAKHIICHCIFTIIIVIHDLLLLPGTWLAPVLLTTIQAASAQRSEFC